MFKIPNVSLAVNNFSEEFIVFNLQQHIRLSTWTLLYITQIKYYYMISVMQLHFIWKRMKIKNKTVYSNPLFFPIVS